MALCYNIQLRGMSLPYLISRGPTGAFSRLKGSNRHIISSLHIKQAVAALGFGRAVQANNTDLNSGRAPAVS